MSKPETIRRCCTAAATALALLAVSSAPAWARLTEVPVKHQPNPIHEETAAVSGSYFSWSQNSKAKPNTFNVYEQAMSSNTPTGTAFRVNVSGSRGFNGGIAGTRLAYQQIVANQSDVRFWNLALHQRSNPPVGVNTTLWEWAPTITGTWILFGRFTNTASNVLLFNLSTHGVHLLATVPLNRSGTNVAVPGQVNGNYATYSVCQPVCVVHLYTISAHSQVAIGKPSGVYDVNPAVTATGTLYWVRTHAKCGTGAQLVTKPLAGVQTPLHTFPTGIDAGALQTYNDGSNDQIFYNRNNCSTHNVDIYRVAN